MAPATRGTSWSLETQAIRVCQDFPEPAPVVRSFTVPDVEYPGWAEVVIVRRTGHDIGLDTLFDVGGTAGFGRVARSDSPG